MRGGAPRSLDDLQSAQREKRATLTMALPEAEADEAMRAGEATDPLLADRQWMLYPIKQPDIFAMAKRAVASFWTVDEIDFSSDVSDLQRLSDGERQALLVVLAFFAQADGLVMENVNTNFMSRVALPEAHYFYSMQMAMEAIHAEAYAIMLDLYLSQEAQRERTLSRVRALASVNKKNEWVEQWMRADRPFAVHLAAFCCVEAIFFSSSFALIFHIRRRKLLPGLSQANDFIARDEGMHVEFGAALLKLLEVPPPSRMFNELLRSAVDVELTFADEMTAEPIVGFGRAELRRHVESQADLLSEMCGYEPIYNASSPFEFMRMQMLLGKANFFEKRPSEYSKAPCVTRAPTDAEFAMVDDF